MTKTNEERLHIAFDRLRNGLAADDLEECRLALSRIQAFKFKKSTGLHAGLAFHEEQTFYDIIDLTDLDLVMRVIAKADGCDPVNPQSALVCAATVLLKFANKCLGRVQPLIDANLAMLLKSIACTKVCLTLLRMLPSYDLTLNPPHYSPSNTFLFSPFLDTTTGTVDGWGLVPYTHQVSNSTALALHEVGEALVPQLWQMVQDGISDGKPSPETAGSLLSGLLFAHSDMPGRVLKVIGADCLVAKLEQWYDAANFGKADSKKQISIEQQRTEGALVHLCSMLLLFPQPRSALVGAGIIHVLAAQLMRSRTDLANTAHGLHVVYRHGLPIEQAMVRSALLCMLDCDKLNIQGYGLALEAFDVAGVINSAAKAFPVTRPSMAEPAMYEGGLAGVRKSLNAQLTSIRKDVAQMDAAMDVYNKGLTVKPASSILRPAALQMMQKASTAPTTSLVPQGASTDSSKKTKTNTSDCEVEPSKKKAKTVDGEEPAPAPSRLPSADLLSAATHVFESYYSRPYDTPSANAPAAFYVDLEPVHGVERPNHGLANAIRKAILVLEVAAALKATSPSIDFSPSMLHTMQVAMLFEVTCRKSEIGFNDDPGVYMQYHDASCAAFNAYAMDNTLEGRATCLEALECMYMTPKTAASEPVKLVFEVCHESTSISSAATARSVWKAS